MATHVSRDTIVKYHDKTDFLEAKNFLSKNSNYMGKRNTKIHVENEGSNHVTMYTSKEWNSRTPLQTWWKLSSTLTMDLEGSCCSESAMMSGKRNHLRNIK